MTAPSFSSFPPVFDSFPDLEQSSSSRPHSTEGAEVLKHRKDKDKKHKADKKRGTKEEEETGHGRDKRNKREDKNHDIDEKAGRGSRHERERSSRHRRRRSASYDDERKRDVDYSTAPESRSRLFYLDRKGDNLNIVYGSLHAGDVPKYRHVGHGRNVLGLESNLAVLYRGGKGVEIGEAGWYSRAPQLTGSRARAMLASKQTRKLTASSKTLLKYEEVDGFISVHSRKEKEKDQEYRSIYIARDECSDSGVSSQNGSESSEDSDTPPMSAREESLRNLEQRVSKDPTSESDWLLLIQHTLNGIVPSSKNAEKARAEISVSILERALSAHPSNARSPLLHLKYLRAGEAIWDVVKMKQEWEKALKYVRSTDIYIEWLDWTIRATPSFNSVVEDAIRATNLLANCGIDAEADCVKLRIFWRITIFFRQAGYVERGFALFQAQAELSFNVPEEDRERPFEERLDALEEFWESEAPRVGEAGATGWKAWKRKKEGDSGRRTHRVDTHEISDPYAAWHFEEKESDRRLIFPARMLSNEEGKDTVEGDEIDEDPYSTVLFIDIRPFLIDLQTAKGRDLLRLVWLAYLGLHTPGLSSALSSKNFSSDDRWADISFLQPSSLRSLFPCGNNRHMITVDSSAGVMVGREKTYAKSFDAVKSWSLGVLDPLEGLTVDGEYRIWSRASFFESDPEVTDVMRRLFREFPQDGLRWSIMALAFEAAISPSESALKHSQALLSENSSSAELLATHAYLERIRRKYERARKVYRVGLHSLAQSGEPSVVCLWWGWAELEWLLSKGNAALEIVLRAAGQPDERASVNILRAKRQLEEFCQPRHVAEWRFRLKWIRLRILLELLVGTLETAIDASERFLASEETGSTRHEALTVASLLMVYHNMVTLRNHAPPAILRGLVEKALDIYPSNSIVIGLFLECEKGEGVWGRVRALMRENAPGTLQDKSVARRLIEVWIANWEEGRWLGEVERIRAGLEASVISDRTKGSAILWKVYVKFEIAAGNAKRAKAVLFRSLKECPMVKELYLLAFEDDLRPAYSRRELMDLSDTMAERGIRLRRSLAEILETETHGAESDGERSDSDQSVNEYEDEQEYESRELKRLMPY